MNLIELIQSDKEAAKSAVADALHTKVFDYLDNYVLESDSAEDLEEEVVAGSVKKDSKGNVVTFKSVGSENPEKNYKDSVDKDMDSRKKFQADFGSKK